MLLCRCRAKKEPHSFLFCDVTGHNNITSMVDDVVRKYGRIDALINNGTKKQWKQTVAASRLCLRRPLVIERVRCPALRLAVV